jgi:hypothetical protein
VTARTPPLQAFADYVGRMAVPVQPGALPYCAVFPQYFTVNRRRNKAQSGEK